METTPLSNEVFDQKDIAEGTFIVKWPKWLRWLLFLPSAFIVPVLFSIVQGLFQTWFLGIGKDAFYLIFIRGGIFGGGFVYVGSYVAPKYQKAVGLFLMILLSILVSMSFIGSMLEGITFNAIAELIITITAGAMVTYSIFREFN